jgi:3',5'-cyclic AMP phosphodiesterase CpdA
MARMPSRWSILSLSDLHYESPDSNYLDDAKELGNLPEFRDDLFRDVDAVLKGLPEGSFDAVVVGGDITTHGKENGFKRFRDEMLPALMKLAPDPSHVCIVPGNHDVEWSLDPTAKGVFERKFRLFNETIAGRGVTSCLIPAGHAGPEGSGYSLTRPLNGPLLVDHDRRLIVLLFNSAIRCGELNARLHNEIADAALQLANALSPDAAAAAASHFDALRAAIARHAIRDVAQVTQLQTNQLQQELAALKTELGAEWRAYLRVGVLHHHLVSFADQQTEHKSFESVLDAAKVLKLLGEFDFDLVLTGHKHQPYVEVRATREHEFLLVGGPTVGGYSNWFRGLRILDVQDGDDHRVVKVVDIPHHVGSADAAGQIASLRASVNNGNVRTIPRRVHSLAHRSQLAGYSYRQVASITVIDADGDARRAVEFEDLLITDNRDSRSRGHRVELPPTSGHLSTLTARGRDFAIAVEPIPEQPRHQSWTAELAFDQDVGLGDRPASYAYEWRAVNAFARNDEEFALKYRGRPPIATNTEFTHFVVKDPIAELTVIVGLPPSFKSRQPPTVRVTRYDPNLPEGERWIIDATLKTALTNARALRYYEFLNVAALRVSNPLPGVSYGIAWELPAAAWPPQDDGAINAFRDGYHQGAFRKRGPDILLNALIDALRGVRYSIGEDWIGELDISFIMFSARAKQPLFVVSAVREYVVKKQSKREFRYGEVEYRGGFDYGDGIAGRAFKSNQARAYVAPDRLKVSGPDYYSVLPGIPPHQVLLSIPIHVPLSEKEFKAKAKATEDPYETRRPYGVISIGSTESDCPLLKFYGEPSDDGMRNLQHHLSGILFKSIQKIRRSH